ncbi:MAG: hypothetical protein JST92_22280 [Deltaproteobacteria bacterium]|nr:hypothetical protein [Deltaproteobacteria bacterium]
MTGTPTVTITPGVTVPSAATSVPVSPTSTTTYTLSAIAPTDSAAVTSTVTVIVTPAPAITSFAAKEGESATDHPRGSALDLVWVSTGDRFLLGDGSTTTDVGPLRTYTVRPITNTTYTLTAIGISGSATSTLSVTVTGADGASLVYTDPPAGSAAVRLVKDASSTATHLVLDAVLTQTASAISGLAMNLPLDGTTPGSRDGMLRVAMDDAAAASLPSGFMTVAPGFDVNTAAIPAWSGGGAPGSSHPAAALAKLPVAGPLMGVLAFGAAWKPSAACTSNSADCQGTSATAGTGTNGTVLARVRLKLVPSGGVGPVFSGTGGTGFRAELRDGTLGSLSTFAVGTLVVQ